MCSVTHYSCSMRTAVMYLSEYGSRMSTYALGAFIGITSKLLICLVKWEWSAHKKKN